MNDLATAARGLGQTLGAAQNFSQGRTVPGALNTVGAAGAGLQLGSRFLPVSSETASLLNSGGNALGALGGLAGLGYSLANGQGDPTVAQGMGYLQSGLTGAGQAATAAAPVISSVSPAAGAALGSAGAGLSTFAPVAGGVFGTVQGADALLGSHEGRQYDPSVDNVSGALYLAGAAAAVPTMGLSLLVAPIVDAIAGAFGSHEPTHYFAVRNRSQQVSQNAVQSLVGQYGQAAQRGGPAQILGALQQGAGDIKGQARRPVRAALDPAIAATLGLPGGDFNQMSVDDYNKMLNYFGEDPTRLTALKGNELGGSGIGAIHGSGDVPYLDQQAAQTVAYQIAGAAQELIRSQLMESSQSPKMAEVRTVWQLKHMTPQQLASLPAETRQMVQNADPNFDPWSSKNPLADFQKSAADKPLRDKAAADQAQAAERARAEWWALNRDTR